MAREAQASETHRLKKAFPDPVGNEHRAVVVRCAQRELPLDLRALHAALSAAAAAALLSRCGLEDVLLPVQKVYGFLALAVAELRRRDVALRRVVVRDVRLVRLLQIDINVVFPAQHRDVRDRADRCERLVVGLAVRADVELHRDEHQRHQLANLVAQLDLPRVVREIRVQPVNVAGALHHQIPHRRAEAADHRHASVVATVRYVCPEDEKKAHDDTDVHVLSRGKQERSGARAQGREQ